MNLPASAVVFRIMSSVILIAVVGSLCFSVGEGLRLAPFPISHLVKGAASDTTLTPQASGQISNYRYGPLGVSTSTSKRNKRQSVAIDFPTTSYTSEVPTSHYFAPTHERLETASVLVMSRSAGRAPPLVS